MVLWRIEKRLNTGSEREQRICPNLGPLGLQGSLYRNDICSITRFYYGADVLWKGISHLKSWKRGNDQYQSSIRLHVKDETPMLEMFEMFEMMDRWIDGSGPNLRISADGQTISCKQALERRLYPNEWARLDLPWQEWRWGFSLPGAGQGSPLTIFIERIWSP